MAKYKAYPKYKDSGVEWLGLVPESWTVCRLKNLATIKNGQDYKSVQTDDGYPVMGSGGQFTFASKFMYDKPSVLLGRKGTIDKPLYINEPFWTVDTMYYTELNEGFDAKYLHYLALTIQFSRYSTNTALPSMTQEHLSNYKFSVPKAESERKKITEFLDLETAKIDNLIEKQQQLIELLKEKRQAVISHAVTKGLNPDVPMKDSGVEWLGEVPEHWNVKKLKYACASIIAGPFGSSITKDMYVNDGYKVYGQEQVIPNDFNIGDYFISTKDFEKLSRYEINAGDILISCVGTFGKIAVFPDWARVGIINPRLIKATLAPKMNPSFIREFLKSTVVSKQFELLSRGGTMGVINIAILNEIMISIPPIEEQNSINEFIHSQKKKFFELIDNANSQINLLQERRTALISAAVTGKIDVRDWVAPDTQNVEEPQEATA
ncbi:restriction endonuclease subunit S [Klebsiella aerogenes]|uniref:restriction endonuclease subunit S n=1 Tax=Klebsiella aerogenes TaxID=548 RepID=UPI001BB2EA73|nr:restriction endonuclease subunit S [Klebsiella aerogenes]QUS03899.1 restriction endonuclease subunit S [Klebsiella aerogenes]